MTASFTLSADQARLATFVVLWSGRVWGTTALGHILVDAFPDVAQVVAGLAQRARLHPDSQVWTRPALWFTPNAKDGIYFFAGHTLGRPRAFVAPAHPHQNGRPFVVSGAGAPDLVVYYDPPHGYHLSELRPAAPPAIALKTWEVERRAVQRTLAHSDRLPLSLLGCLSDPNKRPLQLLGVGDQPIGWRTASSIYGPPISTTTPFSLIADGIIEDSRTGQIQCALHCGRTFERTLAELRASWFSSETLAL